MRLTGISLLGHCEESHASLWDKLCDEAIWFFLSVARTRLLRRKVYPKAKRGTPFHEPELTGVCSNSS